MSRPVDPRLARAVPALRPLLAAVAACQVVIGLAAVAQAGLLARSIVLVFGQHVYGRELVVTLTWLAVAGLARAFAGSGVEFLSARASIKVRAQLRRSTLDAIVRLGPAWVQRQPAGRLANATGPGLEALDGYVTRALPSLVAACVVPPIVLARIGIADWQAGLLLLAMLPLVPLFMALVGVTTRRRVQRQYEMLTKIAGHFLDLLRGLTTLTVYGQAARQETTLRKATEQYRAQTMSALRIAFMSALILDLAAALSIAVVAVDIGLRLDGGSVSFFVALVVLLLAPELFAPLRAMGANYHANTEGMTAASAALDIIDEAPPAAAGDRTAEIASSGAIAFDSVTVQYPGRTEPAIDRLSLSVQPGEYVALVGESGAGKSTMIAALIGFVAADAGDIVAGVREDLTRDDLVRVADLDPDAWRRSVAWLPQRPVPSQRTVADEVRLGDPGAGDDAVALVCGQCRTPSPSTVLGQDGRWVSAGQRRRIALARAVLRAQAVLRRGATPIVLLDEPSEDLDRDTELVVATVLASLAGSATIIVATHSRVLSDLADRRVTLSAGRVISNVRQTRSTPARSAVAWEPVVARGDLAPVSVQTPQRLRLRDLVRSGGALGRLSGAAALSALAGLTGLGLTASSMWLISRAAQHPNVQALAIAVVGVRFFAISRALLRYAERLASHDAALRLLTGLRVRVFAALRPLGPSALGGFGRGDLLRRFVGDVDGVQDGLVRTVVPLIGAVATAAGAVILAAALVPAAGLVLLAALALGAGLIPWASKRGTGDLAGPAALAGDRDARCAVTVEAIGELVAYGAAETNVADVTAIDAAIAAQTMRPALATSGGLLASGAVAAVALPAVVFAGARAVAAGHLDAVNLGVLAVCVLIGFEAVNPLPAAFGAWARCTAGLGRVAAVLSARAPFAEPVTAAQVPLDSVGLHGRALTLAPAADEPELLCDVDLRLDAGERVAVIGPSGCGKSTLLAAALRLVRPAGGSFALAAGARQEVDLAHIRAADVPPLIAGSLQGDHVFDTTLRDNLRVVRPDATDLDLDVIARRAGLGTLLESLPEGWSTPAGPDGASLSGGQRQRLLLARALLADPAILVLDEPTAHLDARTEQAVLADLFDATAGRTVLLSTHRVLPDGSVTKTLRFCNQKLELESALVAPGGSTEMRTAKG